ncbi:MAG: sulfatase [Planctomycetota bacterium]
MSRLSLMLFCSAVFSLLQGSFLQGESSTLQPNIIILFIDDLGYADIQPFGARAYETPALERMARQGRRFTDFVVASAVCSASRAALLTGCIHERVGFRGALGPDAKVGIDARETTIAELCKSKGYATACFGKWHLGHHPKFLPQAHGFDRYYGLPYSNDMWPFHPAALEAQKKDPNRKPLFPPLPMVEGSAVCDPEVTAEDQQQMTAQYTRRAVEFIRENRDKPFFLYLPHSMVHVPLFSSPDFAGKHPSGPFADAVREIDWSVGQILDAVDELNLTQKTLIVFTSDNGPWLSYGTHGGSAFPLREGKGTAWEGGVRVPTIMQYQGVIPAGSTCDQLASTIDLLPTIAKLIEAELPERTFDGHDISPLLVDDQARSPHASFPYYYGNGQLLAIRNDRWKLVFPHEYRTISGQQGRSDGMPVNYRQQQITTRELYDLDSDVGETTNVADQYPQLVAQFSEEADRWRKELGDSLTGVQGNAIRPLGKIQAGDRLLVDE